MINLKFSKIPLHRLKEIKKLYSVFYDENKQLYDLNLRKSKFFSIVKLKYKWLTFNEYENIYNENFKDKELEFFLNIKKVQIEEKFKKDILKLFCFLDTNNDNCIDLNEFELILMKLNIYNYSEIKDLFNKADLNGDGILTIDEFMMFLSKNDFIAEKLKEILDYKFEVKKKHDKRTLLFKDFPGSPLKNNWRPSLSNLNSTEFIKKHI